MFMYSLSSLALIIAVSVRGGIANRDQVIDGQLEISADDDDFTFDEGPVIDVHVPPVTCVESLILNMIDQDGIEVCGSAFTLSVMKSVWRREVENTAEEMEARARLLDVCADARYREDVRNREDIRNRDRENNRLTDIRDPPLRKFPGRNGTKEVKVWDVLATRAVLSRSMPRGVQGDVPLAASQTLHEPTPEDIVEINALLKSKEGECTPRMTPFPFPLDSDPAVMLYPKCVMTKRCGGCCNHAALECAPSDVENIKHKVVGMVGSKMSLKEIIVEQHKKCKCECRVKAKDCNSKQKYDSKSCTCRCNKVSKCAKPQEWVDKQCQCTCPERLRKDCSTGMFYDTKKCKCILGASLLLK